MTPDEAPVDILRTPAAGGRVIRGGVIRALGFAVGIVLAAATSVFLFRALGVDEFGRYVTVAALLGIVSTVTDAGLTSVGARELALRPAGREREELLRVLLGLRIVLTVAGVALATLFAVAAGYDRVMIAGTALAGLGVLLVNVQATAMMPLSVELRMGSLTSFEVARQALTLVGVAALGLAGASLLPFFAVQAAVGAGVLLATPLVMGGVRSLAAGLDRDTAWRLVREALPLAIAIAMNVVYLRLVLILLSLTADETTTGLFGTSFRVFEMLIGIPVVLLTVALPVLSVAGAEDRERLRYGVRRLTEVALLAGLLCALMAFALADPAIRLIAPDDYDGAAPILRIQAWALVPLFVGQVLVLTLVAMSRQRDVAVANAGALVVVLVLGAVLSHTSGGEGAAVATVVTETLLTLALAVQLARADRTVAPGLTWAWRHVVAIAAGLAPLAFLGLDSWLGAVAAGLAFVVAALAVRAVPPEVALALTGRDPGGAP